MRGPIVSHVRALRRLAALAWVVVSSAASFVLVSRHRRDLRARAMWLRAVCARALRALGVEARCIGPAPAGQVVVANHLGYLDILALAAAAPCVFVAKREVRQWPVFGWFARQAGTRFIDREKRADVARVGNEFAPALRAGVNVVLFLEGTSTAGDGVRPFKSSLLEPAVQGGWTVTPAAIAYAVPAGYSVADDVCWWGEMELLPHLWRLFAVPRIAASVAWGESLAPGVDRKELARAAHRAVVGLRAIANHATERRTVLPSRTVGEQRFQTP